MDESYGLALELVSSVINRQSQWNYAIVFLAIALIAALFGFGGVAVGAAGIAKILFVVFLIGAVVFSSLHSRQFDDGESEGNPAMFSFENFPWLHGGASSATNLARNLRKEGP